MQEEEVKDWVEFAKKHKQNMANNNERGDFSPMVIVENNNHIDMVVISPEVDKRLAFQACALIHSSIDPDSLIVILDARMASSKISKEGKNTEEAKEDIAKKFPSGSMQKICEEGRGEEEGIVETLLCYKITRDGETSMLNMPYTFKGKGQPIEWKDSEFIWLYGKDGNIQGNVPDSLSEIMKLPIFRGDETRGLRKISSLWSAEEREARVAYHSARAIMALLANKQYLIMDFITGKHPEWSGGDSRGLQLLSKLIDDGFFPAEASEPVGELISKYIATKQFREKFVKLMEENSYWLPNGIRDDIPKFAFEFENMCVTPTPTFDESGNLIDPFANEEWDSDSDDEDDWGDSADILAERWTGQERRVEVWNGDKSEFLGKGRYVGDVKVYFVRLEDGTIVSNRNAEEQPNPELIPYGADIIKAGKNPKIILDNGNIVYGCQVWWQDCKE